jgi:hypothetical protein
VEKEGGWEKQVDNSTRTPSSVFKYDYRDLKISNFVILEGFIIAVFFLPTTTTTQTLVTKQQYKCSCFFHELFYLKRGRD